MGQMRQEGTTADRLVARLALRKLAPHAVVGLTGLAASAALVAAYGGPAELGPIAFGLASLVLVAGLTLMSRKLELVVDHQGIHCPGDALVMPWGDVASLDLTGRSVLRVEVRDGLGLLARQSPELSMWRARRRRLAESGVLDCPVGILDRSPTEILQAAMRLRAADGGAPPSVREEVAIAQVVGSERRETRRHRLVIGVSAALCVVELLTVARVYLF